MYILYTWNRNNREKCKGCFIWLHTDIVARCMTASIDTICVSVCGWNLSHTAYKHVEHRMDAIENQLPSMWAKFVQKPNSCQIV